MSKTLGTDAGSSLLPGEKVAVRTRRVLSRKGRSVVRVRVVGDASLGWLDSMELWGACVELFVCHGGNVKHLAERLYPDVYIAPVAESVQIPPHRCWNGLLAGTLSSEQDAIEVMTLIDAWRPAVFILACHCTMSRRQVHRVFNPKSLGNDYDHVEQYQCTHRRFGGVTTSSWKIVFGVQRSTSFNVDLSITRMTASLYERCLQTALDDTIGPPRGKRRLDTGKTSLAGMSKEVVGLVDGVHRVYAGSGFGPDLSTLSSQEMHHLWVLAVSVYSKEKVLRCITLLEILAMWDYAGKIWYHGMADETIWELLHARIRSPPGKILTAIAFSLCQQILESILPQYAQVLEPIAKSPAHLHRKGQMELKGIQRAKAAVADDAGIELAYWALPNETPEQTKARVRLRNFAHKWWVMNLAREAYAWLKRNGNHPADREVIEICLRRAAGSDYWDWHRGSTLLFWRFPVECDWRLEARDGVEFWHLTDPPRGLHFQNIPPSTREGELQIRAKVFQLKFRGYIEPGNPDLVIPRFAVEKVADESENVLDIRAVWDAKRNGFNETIWAPKFSLPTTQDAEDLVMKWLLVPVEEYLRGGSPPQDYTQDQSLYIKSYQFDHDVGQQFNNFTLHKKERHSHGVRFIHTRNDGSPEPQSFLQCSALSFGCLASPYIATQGQERIMEMVEGEPSDENNPFHYDKCYLNLPSSKEYDPSLPRILLLRRDGEVATRRVTFVDDHRGVGRGRDGSQAGEGARVMAFKMNYFGNQCAGRKFGPPTLISRPWNGVMTHTDSPYPVKGTTAKKWNRGRSGLSWIWKQCDFEDNLMDPIAYIDAQDQWKVYIDTAELRRIAGLWIHITELYTEGRCFLKGFFNALESFRIDRDLDGWRLNDAMDSARDLEERDCSRTEAASGYPAVTRVTYQLVLHVQALRRLFDSEEPRVSLIRPTEKACLRYACGDASAEGFAQATQYPNLIIDERDGLWLPEVSAQSSNLREAMNIANHLKRDIAAGRHDGCELWQATDNAVWSAVCNKGMSSVRHLFDLLVDIKVLCHEHEVFYHCFHISGDRMIATGIDGLSRGDHESGITLGYDLRDYLPLDRSAFDYPDNSLERFCRSWMGDDYSPPATPVDWFCKAQKPGIHIIAPPPAAAVYALKEVARARHKRPRHVTYVILIPRLLYQEEWRSRFQKEVDVWFTLSNGDYWPHIAYEPLLVGISFPLYRTQPWLLRMERDKVVGLGRSLSEMSKQSNFLVGDHLRKLWQDPRAFIQGL